MRTKTVCALSTSLVVPSDDSGQSKCGVLMRVANLIPVPLISSTALRTGLCGGSTGRSMFRQATLGVRGTDWLEVARFLRLTHDVRDALACVGIRRLIRHIDQMRFRSPAFRFVSKVVSRAPLFVMHRCDKLTSKRVRASGAESSLGVRLFDRDLYREGFQEPALGNLTTRKILMQQGVSRLSPTYGGRSPAGQA